MRTRRLPTGGLAALAVLLAALAVVVAAGAPPPRTIVETVHAATTTPSVAHPTSRTHPATKRKGVGHDAPDRHVTESDATSSGAGARGVGALGVGSRPGATSTTSTTTTTSPVRAPVTPTTRPPVARTSADAVMRDGTFAVGETSATAHVGSVQEVTVSVREAVKVTLTVACGLSAASATAVSTVSVRVPGGECTATFAVPAGSPHPVPWRLVTT